MEREEILKRVHEFIALNERRRSKDLTALEVERWYTLRTEIEASLFAKPPAPQREQRRHIRVGNLKIPAIVESLEGETEGTIREVSEGGLFLATKSPLPVGSAVRLRLEEGSESILLHLQVIYSNPAQSFLDRAFSGMGLKILEGEQNSAAILRRWESFVDASLTKAAR